MEPFNSVIDYDRKLRSGLQSALRDFSRKAQDAPASASKLATEILQAYQTTVENHYKQRVLPNLNDKAIEFFDQCKSKGLVRADKAISYALENFLSNNCQGIGKIRVF